MFPTMIKTSISAAARVSSGIGGREGVAGGVCAPRAQQSDAAAANVPPSSVKHQGGEWRGTGLQGRGRLD